MGPCKCPPFVPCDCGITDTFDRAAAVGWGTASSGRAWDISFGDPASFSLDGTRGLMVLENGVTYTYAYAQLYRFAYSEARVLAQVTDNAGGPSADELVVLAGDTADFDDFFELQFATNGDLTLDTNLASDSAGTSVDPLQPFYMRILLDGTNLNGKVWQADVAEPGTWDVTVPFAYTEMYEDAYLKLTSFVGGLPRFEVAFDNYDIPGITACTFLATDWANAWVEAPTDVAGTWAIGDDYAVLGTDYAGTGHNSVSSGIGLAVTSPNPHLEQLRHVVRFTIPFSMTPPDDEGGSTADVVSLSFGAHWPVNPLWTGGATLSVAVAHHSGVFSTTFRLEWDTGTITSGSVQTTVAGNLAADNVIRLLTLEWFGNNVRLILDGLRYLSSTDDPLEPVPWSSPVEADGEFDMFFLASDGGALIPLTNEKQWKIGIIDGAASGSDGIGPLGLFVCGDYSCPPETIDSFANRSATVDYAGTPGGLGTSDPTAIPTTGAAQDATSLLTVLGGALEMTCGTSDAVFGGGGVYSLEDGGAVLAFLDRDDVTVHVAFVSNNVGLASSAGARVMLQVGSTTFILDRGNGGSTILRVQLTQTPNSDVQVVGTVGGAGDWDDGAVWELEVRRIRGGETLARFWQGARPDWQFSIPQVAGVLEDKIIGLQGSGFDGSVTFTDLAWQDNACVADGVTPSANQAVHDELLGVGDGVTTVFTTRYPYNPQSLEVEVDGEGEDVDPTNYLTGSLTMLTAPGSGLEVRASYLRAEYS